MTEASSAAPIPAVALPADRLIEECEITFARRGGPGGQHRNKVSSAVILKHRPTGITAEASERRSQAENRSVAVCRLRIELALQLRPDLTAWTGELVPKYGTGQFRISTNNDSFPVVLADVLNRTLAHEGAVDQAAAYWKTSSSQIIRFLKQEPRAFEMVNRHRMLAGRHRLK